MGSRLGALIRSESGWEVYYDHWAAQTVGIDVALDGVDATLERVRKMQPTGVEHPQDWDGATWIEGTLLVDQTKRLVVWAEEYGEGYAPRIINQLIEHTWPGWTAVWSPEGTRGVLRACGVDPATIFHGAEEDPVFYSDAPDLYPWEEWHGSDPITVILPDYRIVTWNAYAFLDDLAHLGPARFLEIAETVTRRQNVEAEAWLATQDDDLPTGGIFIDYPEHEVQWWSFGARNMHIPVFEQLWSDWTITCRGDDYGWHERIVGRILRTQDLDIAEFEECAIEALEEGRRKNPFFRLANALTATGESVSPLPATLIFEAAERDRDVSEVLAFTAKLRESPASAARFITARGEFVPALDQSW